MAATVRQMFALPNATSTQTVLVPGGPSTFLAWTDVTWIDSTNNFDSDNAVAIDIPFVNGNRTGAVLNGGAHLGAPGAFTNLHEGALVRFGSSVTFRLRSFGPDLNCLGYGIIITNP